MPGSALYVGHVMHHRLRPKEHRLKHGVYWIMLDLDEASLLGKRLRLFSFNAGNLVSFRDSDHGDGSGRPLKKQIIGLLEGAGVTSEGVTVRILCMPRVFGYDFNPLSVYYCTDAQDRLVAMVYEVNNTFGERHTYVIPADRAGGEGVEQACDKQFYVSPFLEMDMSYRFRARSPGDTVSLTVQGYDADGPIIDTGLYGWRRPLTDGEIVKMLALLPLLTLKVIGAIHWHALKMWAKGFRLTSKPAAPDRLHTIVRSNR